MTKAGIGTTPSDRETTTTTTTANTNGQQNGNTTTTSTTNNNNTSGTSNQNGVDQAEIPIWVADKKKWVTGISKKTTVNDLIHAILKQCQIAITDVQAAAQYVLVEFETSPAPITANNENINPNDSQQQHQVINSQKIIDGDSKVTIRVFIYNILK